MNNKVSIEKCQVYDPEELYRALKNSAEAAGIPDIENIKNKSVLIKPNLLMDAAPSRAVTTHPVFVEAVIRLVKEWGASRVIVGDSPGLQGPKFTGRVAGIEDAVKKTGSEWADFTKGKTEIEYAQGKVQQRFSITAFYDEVDTIINLPKLKTHQLMHFTGAMKNMFGLVPSVAKSPYHARYSTRDAFGTMITDLILAIKKPVYNFMDAVIGMEGPGPGSGSPRQIGLVLASSNILAIDIAACSIIGYPPQLLSINKDALARRIWLNDMSEIEYPLLKPSDVAVPDYIKIPFRKSKNQLIDFILPKPLRKLRDSKTPYPVINQTLCVRCEDCARICASKAIEVTNAPEEKNPKKVEIVNRQCIRCYCCHEICPVHAINV